MPAAAIPLFAYGSLLAFVSPQVLLFENLWPRDEFSAGRSALLEARTPFTLASGVELLKYTILYAIGCALLVVLARGLDLPRWRRPLIVAGSIAAVLFVAACIAKPDGLRDGIYYIWGWIPLGALVAVDRPPRPPPPALGRLDRDGAARAGGRGRARRARGDDLQRLRGERVDSQCWPCTTCRSPRS